MPRVRTVTAPDGFIHFSKGVSKDYINQLATLNKVEVSLDETTSANEVLLRVPVENPDGTPCVYEIPDEIYVWVNIPPAAAKGHVLR